MCGRYALIDGKKVFATFPVLQQTTIDREAFKALPQYNAAPMGRMPVIVMRDGSLSVQLMQWWLVPHWSKEPKTQFSTFNAKGETLDQSRLFAPYFKGSRCLVPADAFYEWKKETVSKEGGGKGKKVVEKHPMCIRMKNERPFMMAGLFSRWKDQKGEKELSTFTIVTTTPNPLLEKIHNRMPVILGERHFEAWLDRENKDTESLKKLLVPYPDREMKAYRVSKIMNASRNNVEECIIPLRNGE